MVLDEYCGEYGRTAVNEAGASVGEIFELSAMRVLVTMRHGKSSGLIA